MNNYNCRLADGSLKLVLPGQTRKALYCPGCAHPYRSDGCLFRKNQPEPKKIPMRGLSRAGTTSATPTRIIADVKKRWLELNRVPLKKDFGPQYGTLHSRSICKFPGGIKHALKVAAAELGLELTYKCERCGKELISAAGLSQHRHYCKAKEAL